MIFLLLVAFTLLVSAVYLGSTKLLRIWKAFCRGFWQAWLEIPPQRTRSVGELTMTLSCDSSQFDREIDGAIQKLRELKTAGLSL